MIFWPIFSKKTYKNFKTSSLQSRNCNKNTVNMGKKESHSTFRNIQEKENKTLQLTSSMLSDFRTKRSKPRSLEKTKEVCNAGQNK